MEDDDAAVRRRVWGQEFRLVGSERQGWRVEDVEDYESEVDNFGGVVPTSETVEKIPGIGGRYFPNQYTFD